MTYLRKILFLLILPCLTFSAEDVKGFWKTINEEGKAQCILAVYEYEGTYYGRIIGTFNDEGIMDDDIYHPVKRAPGVPGQPYYSGLDIIWNLHDDGSKFKGKIMDPEKGKVYNCELWIEGKNLIVRGKLLFFGRSQEWLPVEKSDFPKGFKKPNTKKFVPSVALN